MIAGPQTIDLPKQAHELTTHPELGDLAKATNSVVCDLYMVQTPEARRRWLERMVDDATSLANAARDLLARTP